MAFPATQGSLRAGTADKLIRAANMDSRKIRTAKPSTSEGPDLK
jgi:hypothetical protein